MKSSSFYPVLVAVILFDTLQLTTSLPAQSIWLDNDQCNSISIEILKPEFIKGYNEYTFVSSAIFLSGRYLLDENIFVVWELPFARGEFEPNIIATVPFDYYFGEYNSYETIIGNPYIGIEIRAEELPVFGEFGIRFPFAPYDNQYATNVGISSDYDRYDAFAPNVFLITGKGNYLLKYSQNFLYRLRFGPTLWFYTRNTELWFNYSGQFEYKHENVTVIFGLSGRFLTNDPDQKYYHPNAHHLGIAASTGFGIVRPGMHFRFPIYGNDLVNFVYGLNLVVQLP